MKFKQILALVFAISLGYGAGQQGGKLWATDYPGGGGIGSHDTDSGVHNLGAGINVLGNLDASGEFIQRENTVDMTVGSSDRTVFEQNSTVTYGTAFSANPIVLVSGAESSAGDQWAGVRNITTTTALISVFIITASQTLTNVGWVALGS